MDYHIFKSLLNRLYSHYVGGDRRPVFFDVSSICPALDAVTESYPVIRRELDHLLDRRGVLPRYHDVDTGEADISDTTAHNWNVFMLEILGHRPEQNRACCPETCRVLKGVPNLMQAFFSVLEPCKSIPLHEGPYLGYLRYHLGLRVPDQNPPTLIINSQPYKWKSGEAVMFDDSWPHEVQNDSDDIRAVLIVDILRPMPTLPTLVNRITTDWIARPTYGRKVADKARRFAADANLKRAA